MCCFMISVFLYACHVLIYREMFNLFMMFTVHDWPPVAGVKVILFCALYCLHRVPKISLFCLAPRVEPGHVLSPFPLVHSLPHFVLFFTFPFYLFSFALSFSSFVHRFAFYQNSPTPFCRPDRRRS